MRTVQTVAGAPAAGPLVAGDGTLRSVQARTEVYSVLNDTCAGIVCHRCALADTVRKRTRGLLGRAALDEHEGLLLRPAPSVHTFFMRFPIDVIFLDAAMRVVAIREHVRPWRMRSCRHARAVLELPAGAAARRRIRTGDRLALRLHAVDTPGADRA